MDLIKEEYNVILERKNEKAEGSYTAYLFEEETVYEITDLIYHTLVMMANQGISPSDIEEELKKRAAKRGNLKKFHQVDKNS